jgi:hypothetical protein
MAGGKPAWYALGVLPNKEAKFLEILGSKLTAAGYSSAEVDHDQVASPAVLEAAQGAADVLLWLPQKYIYTVSVVHGGKVGSRGCCESCGSVVMCEVVMSAALPGLLRVAGGSGDQHACQAVHCAAVLQCCSAAVLQCAGATSRVSVHARCWHLDLQAAAVMSAAVGAVARGSSSSWEQ